MTPQGKDPLVEVIKEVFSVIKLAKIVKNTFATRSIYSYGGFGRAFNKISTQLKKMGGQRLLRMFFHRCAIKVSMHWCVYFYEALVFRITERNLVTEVLAELLTEIQHN